MQAWACSSKVSVLCWLDQWVEASRDLSTFPHAAANWVKPFDNRPHHSATVDSVSTWLQRSASPVQNMDKLAPIPDLPLVAIPRPRTRARRRGRARAVRCRFAHRRGAAEPPRCAAGDRDHRAHGAARCAGRRRHHARPPMSTRHAAGGRLMVAPNCDAAVRAGSACWPCPAWPRPPRPSPRWRPARARSRSCFPPR